MTMSDRGFLYHSPIETAYGAIVRFYESSAASGPHIWMAVEQPPPVLASDLPQHPGRVHAHMTLDQARAVRESLDHIIIYMERSNRDFLDVDPVTHQIEDHDPDKDYR